MNGQSLNDTYYVVDWHSSDIAPEDDSTDESESENIKKKPECKKEFIIRAYCIDELKRSVMINITDFNPYFFVKVPLNWTESHAKMFFAGLKEKVDKWFKNTLKEFKLIRAKPFYGFTANDKFLYVKLSFTCHTGFRKYADLFLNNKKVRITGLNNSQPYYYEPYESNLEPLLRFMHCQDLKAAGWLQVKNFKHMDNITTSAYCLSCKWTDVHSIDKDDMPMIKYVGFDIEADSSHGDFPIANKTYEKLAQDIIAEYIKISISKDIVDMRLLISKFLYYAFNKCYNNNNIYCIKLACTNADIETKIFKLIDTYAFKFLEFLKLKAEEDILELLEANFPAIDTSVCDYLTVAGQLIKEFQKLKSINDEDMKRDEIGVVKLLLTLVFDPYYKNLNINRIYTVNDVSPSSETLTLLIPTIFKICVNAAKSAETEKKIKRLRKAKVKKENMPEAWEFKVDKYVKDLTALLDKHLPPVKDDRVIQIGSTFKRYGETDCYLKHIICLKGCEPINNETMIDYEYQGIEIPKSELIDLASKLSISLDLDLDLPENVKLLNEKVLSVLKLNQLKTDKSQVIVESYDTEEEVLMAWQRLMVKENPDLVVGYNIFGFDYKFMYDRAEKLNIVKEFSKLGRIRGESQPLTEQKLQSAGMGDNLLHYIEMEGRISIDLYKVMQKMHQLDSYTLNSVCKQFLYKSKVDISPAEIFIKQKGSDKDRREIAEYCLIDCVLCNRLMDKFEIIINNIGMAQVCSVPLGFLFLRGQGIKLFSYVAKCCRQEGYLITVLDQIEDDGKYEGAIVLDPIKGIHYNAVAVADFNSLYPSCTISENLSHNSFVSSLIVSLNASTDYYKKPLSDSTYELNLINGVYEGWDYVDIVYDIYKPVPVAPGRKTMKNTVSGHKICRFAQPPNGKKDILPRIQIDLIKQRKIAKQTAATHAKGSFLYNVYDGLQLAYKVTANSLYGYVGANTSKIREKNVAACVTAVGRKLIMTTCNFIKENYLGSKIVYGDTDSVFASFKTVNKKTGKHLTGMASVMKNILYCTEAAYLISKKLKYPHNLEFEKAIFPFILLSKKRYHGHYFTEYGSAEYFAKSMGIVMKRRDNAPIVKYIFGGMLKIIMEEHSIDKAIQFVKEECRKVLKGEFPMDMFIISKTLRSYYKNPLQIAHNVLAQRIGARDPGSKPNSNDRIPYVYIVNPEAEMQGDRIETPDYVLKHKCKIDYGHYLTFQIEKPVMQIFDLAGKGQTVFSDLLQEYQMILSGQTKLTGFGIKILDRSKMGLKPVPVPLKKEFQNSDDETDDDDSDSDNDSDED